MSGEDNFIQETRGEEDEEFGEEEPVAKQNLKKRNYCGQNRSKENDQRRH